MPGQAGSGTDPTEQRIQDPGGDGKPAVACAVSGRVDGLDGLNRQRQQGVVVGWCREPMVVM